MPVDHKNKIIFVHIPKCGGTSVESFFDMRNKESLYDDLSSDINKNGVTYSLQHLTPNFIKELIPDVYDDYIKFTIIRNPYERVLSEYVWQNIYFPIENQDLSDFNWEIYLELNDDLIKAGVDNENKAKEHWIIHGKKEGRKCSMPKILSVNHFTEWLNTYYSKIDTDHKLPQIDYVYDKKSKKVLVENILRLENIEEDFGNFLKKINYKGENKIEKLNKTNSNKYNDFLTQENKNIIYKIYKKDFNYFNYKK